MVNATIGNVTYFLNTTIFDNPYSVQKDFKEAAALAVNQMLDKARENFTVLLWLSLLLGVLSFLCMACYIMGIGKEPKYFFFVGWVLGFLAAVCAGNALFMSYK